MQDSMLSKGRFARIWRIDTPFLHNRAFAATRSNSTLVVIVMRLWQQKSALVAAMLTVVSSIATGCPDAKDWKSFSSISFTSGNAGSLTLARFSDGTYARVEDEKSTKEMYQLNNGLYLYKGYVPSKQAEPSPFFMLDMPTGIVLNFLAQYFKQPCSVGSTPTPFTYALTSGKSTIEVSGSAYRIGTSTVVFELAAVERQERGTNVKASGKVTFFDITPVPPDTLISDWVISRGSGIGTPAELVEPTQIVETFGDLGTLIQGKPKQ